MTVALHEPVQRRRPGYQSNEVRQEYDRSNIGLRELHQAIFNATRRCENVRRVAGCTARYASLLGYKDHEVAAHFGMSRNQLVNAWRDEMHSGVNCTLLAPEFMPEVLAEAALSTAANKTNGGNRDERTELATD